MAKIRNLVRSDRRLTIREIVDELGLCFYAVRSILTADLDTRRVSAISLSDEQKEHRLQASQEMLNLAENGPDSPTCFINWIFRWKESNFTTLKYEKVMNTVEKKIPGMSPKVETPCIQLEKKYFQEDLPQWNTKYRSEITSQS